MPLSATFDKTYPPANISGGSVTYIGSGYDRIKLVKFSSNNTLSINEPGEIKSMLIVGGGGSGGDGKLITSNPPGRYGGGGGGGAVRIFNDFYTWNLTNNDDTVPSVNVTVGVGGPTPAGLGGVNGFNGGDSVVGPYTAPGGGAGNGNSGGSGGGGAGFDSVPTGGSGSYGGDGGNASGANQHGGGGGGAGGANGQSGSSGGDGGAGKTWSVNGTTYGGGGGGGDTNIYPATVTGGTGGAGGGGDGRFTDGTNGLGGGGGAGKAGGSGVVIFAVADPVLPTPSYSIVSSSDLELAGSTFVMSVTTENVADGVELFYTINNITTADNDFAEVSGNMTVSGNAATFNVVSLTGNVSRIEEFNVELRTGNIAGNIVATSNTIGIESTTTFPTWPSYPNATQLSNELSTWSQSTTTTASQVNLGLGTPGVRHRGAVAHPNGNLYMIPRFVDHFVEIDPVNNVYSEGHTISGWSNNDYTTGCLANNGNIYCMPFNTGAYVGEYDPVANTFTKISITSGFPTGTTSYYSCTLMNDGDIFMVSRLAGKPHLKYTPGSTSVTQLGLSPLVDFAQSGACTDFTGNVWLAPYRNTNVYKYDAGANTFSSLGTIPSASDQYAGIHTGADGNVWGIPHNATSILKVDVAANTFIQASFGASIAGSTKFIGGTLASDGAIYATPFNSTDVLRIDTLANTASRSNYGVSTIKGISGGQSKGPRVYMCAEDSPSVYVLDVKDNGGSNANAIFSFHLGPVSQGGH